MQIAEMILELEAHRARMEAAETIDAVGLNKLEALHVALELAAERYAEYLLHTVEALGPKIDANKADLRRVIHEIGASRLRN
jgi:predicted metalloenzyme YecM